MSRHLMGVVGLATAAIAALAGCSATARSGDEYIVTDTAGATATAQAQQRCARAGLAPKELRRFQVYDSDRGRMADRLYFSCEKSGGSTR